MRAKKRFGQNFLVSNQIIAEIIAAINPKANEILVEIGPGMAALTEPMHKMCSKLIAIEIDRDLSAELEQKFKGETNFELINADALKFDFGSIKAPQKLRVFGNLPYNISTQIIFHLLEQLEHIADMHFMLQKEVVDRIAAPVDSSNYSMLSVLVQYYCQVQDLIYVPPSAFVPKPKVDSKVVALLPHNKLPHTANNLDLFKQLVKQAFNQRRKTISNSLKGLCDQQHFEQAAISPKLRPQNLSVADFVRLANCL